MASRVPDLSRRGLMRLASGLVLGLAMTLGSGCQARRGLANGGGEWRGPFFFILMTDPQFGMTTRNKDFEAETALFERAIAQANRLQPSFVVVCGDMVNLPGDAAQTSELMRIAARLDNDIPIHWVVGNHEISNTPTPESLGWYRSVFGPDWYSFDFSGCHFIVLNSSLLQQPETMPDEAKRQREWLRQDLLRSCRLGIGHRVVFMHHPVYLSDRHEEDGYFVLPRVEREPFLDLLHAHGVSAVFSGHLHRNAIAWDGDLELVTTGPVGKPLGDDPSGFRVVQVRRDRLIHEYHALESMPESVPLPLLGTRSASLRDPVVAGD